MDEKNRLDLKQVILMPEFLISAEWLPFLTTFLFIFAIIYALLVKADVIKIKGANAGIAIAIAMFASTQPWLVEVFQIFLPIAALILVLLFFVVFARDLIKGDGDVLPILAVLVIALLLLGAFWGRLVNMVPLPSWLGADSIVWIIGIVIILLVFLAAYRQQEK